MFYLWFVAYCMFIVFISYFSLLVATILLGIGSAILIITSLYDIIWLEIQGIKLNKRLGLKWNHNWKKDD